MKYLKSKYAKIKACFIAYMISRFAPDYEKTKAENKELKQNIESLPCLCERVRLTPREKALSHKCMQCGGAYMY